MARSTSCLFIMLVALMAIVDAIPLGGARTVLADERSAKRSAKIHWQGVPLVDAAHRLEGVFGDTVFLDRRVDPSQRVTLDVAARRAEDILAPLADQHGFGVSRIDSLVIVGPPSVTRQLRTVAALRTEDIYKLPAAVRATLERRRAVTWPRLTEPRVLVGTLITQRGWRVGGLDLIPHDLWSAGSLPAISFAAQLTTLLAGFDLTFDIRATDQTITIVPLTGSVSIKRRYRLPPNLPEPAAALRQHIPDAQARVADGVASVDARIEDHESLADWLQGRHSTNQRARRTTETRQVYTLRVQEKPVGAVLNELARRLNWKIRIDEARIRAAGISMEKRVSFNVENADEDTLLTKLLSPAGLDYERDGDVLVVIPRK